MFEEPTNTRQTRGATLDALARDDLDLYAIEELDERTARLEAEIARVGIAKSKKLSGRAAADALFGDKNR